MKKKNYTKKRYNKKKNYTKKRYHKKTNYTRKRKYNKKKNKRGGGDSRKGGLFGSLKSIFGSKGFAGEKVPMHDNDEDKREFEKIAQDSRETHIKIIRNKMEEWWSKNKNRFPAPYGFTRSLEAYLQEESPGDWENVVQSRKPECITNPEKCGSVRGLADSYKELWKDITKRKDSIYDDEEPVESIYDEEVDPKKDKERQKRNFHLIRNRGPRTDSKLRRTFSSGPGRRKKSPRTKSSRVKYAKQKALELDSEYDISGRAKGAVEPLAEGIRSAKTGANNMYNSDEMIKLQRKGRELSRSLGGLKGEFKTKIVDAKKKKK